MALNKTMKLLNGVEIPSVALGTWLIPNEDAPKIVQTALEIGYRHIDTAQAYGNEVGVGLGIKNSNLKREDIFIQTKVAAEIKNYDDAVKSIEESLKKLDVDYIDLMIIHCPQPWAEFNWPNRYLKENVEVWKALEKFYKEGKIRAIGVSNFQIGDIENILAHCEIKPMVNQIPVFVTCTPKELIDYCKKNDIVIESYSPLGHGRLLQDERLVSMANKYNVSVPQLCIQYTLQLQTISLPKASSYEHLKSNIDFDFTIEKQDMETLKSL